MRSFPSMNPDADVASFTTTFSSPPQNHFPSGGAGSARRADLPPRHPNSIPAFTSLSRPMAQPSGVFTFSALPPPSPPVAIHRVARGSGSTMSPARKALNNSDNTVSGLDSQGWVFPTPVEMRVGVESEKEVVRGGTASHGEVDMGEFVAEYIDVDENGDVTIAYGDDNVKYSSGSDENKTASRRRRRAGKEIATSSSPKPVPALVGEIEIAVGRGYFTESDMKQIMADDELKKRVAYEPRKVKKTLANRLSAAISKDKKAKHLSHLQDKVLTLEMDASTLSAKCNHMEKAKVELEYENKQLRSRVEEMKQQARLRDSLIEQLNGELNRLKLATGEVWQNGSGYDSSNMQSMNPNMSQPLNINQFHQPQANPHFE